MVKRQKEKQYQSAREHRANSQIRAGTSGTGASSSTVATLPFDCCALSLTPYKTPVLCDNQLGIIFERSNLEDFLKRHGKDPITGKPMKTSAVIELLMDKDGEGRWQCPIMTKPFSNHSKVVAIHLRKQNKAQVYSYQAYQELNLQPKSYTDLVSGAKFSPKRDVLILNDPQSDEIRQQRDWNSFFHVTHAKELSGKDAARSNVRHSVTSTRILEQLQKQTNNDKQDNKSAKVESAASTEIPKWYADDVTGVEYTSAKAAGSLTSTVMEKTQTQERRFATQEEILQAQFKVMRRQKKKGMVNLHTNLGDILLELHCDICPRTCTNFLGLCESNQYQDTHLHRLIPNFMIQGGKTAGKDDKKSVDQSLWGGAFADEFDDRLKHDGPGILSMANQGPGTNRRQFFITFASCSHLDRKHSVFGHVVRGMDVLRKMEKVPTDSKQRPKEELVIQRTDVLVNPAKDAEDSERARIEECIAKRKLQEEQRKAVALGRTKPAPLGITESKTASSTSVVGKYLKRKGQSGPEGSSKKPKEDDESGEATAVAPRLPSPPKKTVFGDFSGW